MARGGIHGHRCRGGAAGTVSSGTAERERRRRRQRAGTFAAGGGGQSPAQTLDVGLADALQLLVPEELQVSVTLLPLVILLADAVNVTVGAGGVGAILKAV